MVNKRLTAGYWRAEWKRSRVVAPFVQASRQAQRLGTRERRASHTSALDISQPPRWQLLFQKAGLVSFLTESRCILTVMKKYRLAQMSDGHYCLVRDLGPVKGGRGLRHHEVIVDFTLRGMMKLSMRAFFKLKRHVIFQKPHEYGS